MNPLKSVAFLSSVEAERDAAEPSGTTTMGIIIPWSAVQIRPPLPYKSIV
jgi:hypothetical protein